MPENKGKMQANTTSKGKGGVVSDRPSTSQSWKEPRGPNPTLNTQTQCCVIHLASLCLASFVTPTCYMTALNTDSPGWPLYKCKSLWHDSIFTVCGLSA